MGFSLAGGMKLWLLYEGVTALPLHLLACKCVRSPSGGINEFAAAKFGCSSRVITSLLHLVACKCARSY